MKPLRAAESIVPLGEFKARAKGLLARVASSRSPLVITRNGRPAAVVLAPSEFDRMCEHQRFLESIAAGLRDAEAGRVLTASELRARLAARRPHRAR